MMPSYSWRGGSFAIAPANIQAHLARFLRGQGQGGLRLPGYGSAFVIAIGGQPPAGGIADGGGDAGVGGEGITVVDGAAGGVAGIAFFQGGQRCAQVAQQVAVKVHTADGLLLALTGDTALHRPVDNGDGHHEFVHGVVRGLGLALPIDVAFLDQRDITVGRGRVIAPATGDDVMHGGFGGLG